MRRNSIGRVTRPGSTVLIPIPGPGSTILVPIPPHPSQRRTHRRSIISMRQGEGASKPFKAVNGFNGKVPWVSGGLRVRRGIF